MTYTVGQIIYLLSRKDVKVFPALVVEEIKRKTLETEIISYIVRLPDKDSSEILLEEISADVFTSLELLQESMIQNAKSQIDRLLEKAKSASTVFKQDEDIDEIIEETNNEKSNNKKTESESENKDSDIATVDLGNGFVGKINLSAI